MRGLLEQTHGRVQQIVFDSEGEYVTLREKFDYLLAAKAGGDIPLAPATAALLCRRVMEIGVSLLLDLYELRPPERQAYVAAFLAELIETPIENRRPGVCLYPGGAPLRPAGTVHTRQGSGARSRRARSQAGPDAHLRHAEHRQDGQDGAGGASQQARRVHRTRRPPGPRRRRSRPARRGPRASAPTPARSLLRPGTGALEAGHAGSHGTEPDAGARDGGGRGSATVDSDPSAIQEILAQLGDLPEQAEEEVKSLEAARKRITQLEAKIASGSVSVLAVTPASLAAAPMVPEPKVVTIIDEVPALDAKTLESAQALAEQMMTHGGELLARGQEIVQQLARWHREPSAAVSPSQDSAAADADSAPVPPAVKPTKEAKNAPAPEPDKPAAQNLEKPGKSTSSADSVTAPQQRILNALAGFAAVGLHQVARANVAVWAGVSASSSGYGNNLGTLRTLGLIDYPKGGYVTLTAAGRKIAQAPREVLHSAGALLDAWCSKISAPQAKILRALHAAYPKAIERGALADAVGVSRASSGYGNNLGTLRSLDLIDYPRAGFAAATALLFPEGLPR